MIALCHPGALRSASGRARSAGRDAPHWGKAEIQLVLCFDCSKALGAEYDPDWYGWEGCGDKLAAPLLGAVVAALAESLPAWKKTNKAVTLAGPLGAHATRPTSAKAKG